MLLLVNMDTCTYRFDLKRHMEKVYYSQHRELFREFNSLRDFEDCFFKQPLDMISDELHRYFSRGFNYLASQEDEGFVDFTFDDENINFGYETMNEIKRYLMNNAMAHLYASMALELMDQTDIEDHLSPNYVIEYMNSWFITFKHRTS